MSTILVKLPQRKRNRVMIIRDEEMISEEYRLRDEKLGNLMKPVEVLEEVEEIIEELEEVEQEVKPLPPPVFTQEFIFANANEPIIIDLGNIPEPALPIRIVQEEIQKAYDKGVSDGQIQAKVTFQIETEKYKNWMSRIDGIIESVAMENQRAMRKYEESVISVSLMVAEHILGHEASDKATLVLEQVRKAISSLDNDLVFKINVHPDSVKILEDTKSSLLANKDDSRKIVIVADESVEPGGCVLETTAGIIDARIKAQLEMLRNPLAETVRDISRQEQQQKLLDIENEKHSEDNDPSKLEQEAMEKIWGKEFFDEDYKEELVSFDSAGNVIKLKDPEEDYVLPLDEKEIEEIIKLDKEYDAALEEFAEIVAEAKLQNEDDFANEEQKELPKTEENKLIKENVPIEENEVENIIEEESPAEEVIIENEIQEELADGSPLADDDENDEQNEKTKNENNKSDDEDFDLDNFIFN